MKKAIIDHWLNKLKTGDVFAINDGLYCLLIFHY